MKNLMDITFILDRSGSMSSMRNDVIGGYESFVKKQREERGDCVFSLVQFDDQYETPFTAVPIQHVSPKLDYSPRGSTALRDAIGRTINAVGERLRRLKERDRPSKVIIVVMTDGEENASHEFTQPQIKDMVKHQSDQYQWEFLFLGANIDSFHVAGSYGVPSWATSNYTYTSGGLRAVFDTVSCYASSARNGEQFNGTLSACQLSNEAKQDANKTGTFVSGTQPSTPTVASKI
jgi:uncharacterized protein YegL